MTAARRTAPEEGHGPRVARLLSPGIEAALEQFASPEVLRAGKVNLIAMDAVVERFGARWPMRREQVHEHVEAVLDRHLGAQGYHLRISETDILVCQPELGRLASQAFCLRLLRDILSHFLGTSELAEVGVHEVLRVSSTGVEARPVDARAVEAAEDEPGAVGGKGLSAPDSLLGPVAVWTPFVAANGRKLEIDCTLDPVIELKGRATIGLRFRRSVTDAATGRDFSAAELERLSRTDRLRIDLGAMAQGLKALRETRRAAPPPTLILPVSFSSLSTLDDRARIVSAFQEARGYARQGLICELRDIEGVPLATLQAAASMIAPSSLFVVGHLTECTRAEARMLKDAGFRALSTECPPNLDGAAFLGWAKQTILTAKQATRSVLIYRLPSLQQAMIAAALGATHAHVGG
ncbi:MAG: hypothetical protein JWP86_374 [Phenylobacterium sp.]|nr:hypothetical protein [Phenylobacterium sp.]MDB5493037.1 hypothetical protein [Phenylobacterium sp.]